MAGLTSGGPDNKAVLGAATSLAGTLFEAEGADMAAAGARAAAARAQANAVRKKAALDFEAAQLRVQAGQSVAAAQHAAREQRRQAELVQSRAIAVAAASGGGVSDPTIVNMLGRIAGEGAYRAGLAIYEGEERARTLRMGAEARDFEGALALQAGADAIEAGELQADAYGIQKGASLFKGASSLFSKYGGIFDEPGSKGGALAQPDMWWGTTERNF